MTLRAARMGAFQLADEHRDSAVGYLQRLRSQYADKRHPMPMPLRNARLAAIDAKISALQAVQLDPLAHPWAEDGSS